MSTLAGYFQQAQLSLAAYATGLERGAFGSQNAEYVGALVLAGMTLRQAEVFADSYSVGDQFTDPVSEFSGTVFASNGVNYFAIRGTEGLFPLAGPINCLTLASYPFP